VLDPSAWDEANSRFLSAALAWLRVLLEGPGERDPSGRSDLGSDPGREVVTGHRRRFLRGATSAEATRELPALPPGSPVEDARAAMVAAAEMNPPPALLILADRLGLSGFERSLLLLCAGVELDTRIPGLLADAHGHPERMYPTFAVGLTLFEDAAWDALSPERPLRYWRLVEINQAGSQPLTTSPLRIDERILNYLKGLNYLDDRLAPLVVPFDRGAVLWEPGDDLPPSHAALVDAIVDHVERSGSMGVSPAIQLLGSDRASKQAISFRVAEAMHVHVYRLPVDLLPTQPGELDMLARLWERESRLLPIALYLEAGRSDEGSHGDAHTASIPRFLAKSAGLFFVDTRDVLSGLRQTALTLDVAKPTRAEQLATWRDALDPTSDSIPEALVAQFDLNLATIRAVVESSGRNGNGTGDGNRWRLWDACLASTRPELDVLAQRIEPKATWHQLVLPEAEMTLLHQIADQVPTRTTVYEEWGFGRRMNRGLGISVLFAGDSGTGKTMAAEIMANHLRLNLYRIDLSAVVSKYIGETEKNLRRLFDAAEEGGAILFFDEADALFGKRSEVKDSHDRYANIEVNYLLQRMEAYRGLAIMATNARKALDAAFIRRLRFIVNFPFPGISDRRLMWERAFPPEVPVAQLDFDRLSRLNLVGGSISNVALNAAFLSARLSEPVTMTAVLEAARAEVRKLEKPIDEVDFRWLESARSGT
jgi:hypothetical protein